MTDIKLDISKLKEQVGAEWTKTIIPALSEYIKIPNISPQFDKHVLTNGHMDKAIDLMVKWVQDQKVPDLKIEVVREKDRTPVILVEVDNPDSKTDDTVLLYGHLDKQPPLTGEWVDGFGPYTPILKDGKLYGRGGADDGYAIFSAVTAIKALKTQKVPCARCVVIIEASEESGSPDLLHYIKKLKDRIGKPSLVICLDSGCGNYEQLWLTTSLRGNMTIEFRVKVLKEGVHSGAASGVVPSSFRIIRQLLDRIEDSKTGKMLPEAYCEVPKHHVEHAKEIAETLGDSVWEVYPWVEGMKPVEDDLVESLLNRTWRPTLCITGAGGIPSLSDAGNVLRQETSLKLSVRLPPLVKTKPVIEALKKALTTNVPYGAKVEFIVDKAGQGWMAPKHEPWLDEAVSSASLEFWGKPARFFGEGGSIPFMAMLGQRFPSTQFLVLGVLGPSSNAHGPNEFLHIEMAKNVTSSVATFLAKHYANRAQRGKRKQLESTTDSSSTKSKI